MINDTSWEDEVKKKIRYMTNSVWSGIHYTQVEEFIQNFEPNNQIVGWVLLDMLIYYSNEQEESIISNLIRLLKRDVWLNENVVNKELSSEMIQNQLNSILENMCFVPVDESDISASAFTMTPQFKKSKDLPRKTRFIKITDIPLMIAMQNKYFVFYDDIIGTGEQFKKFWEKPIFGDNKDISIGALAQKNPDKIFYLLVLGGCQEGIDKLNGVFPNLRIIVSEYFPNNYDIFSEENEYWELNPDKKDMVREYISTKEKELKIKNAFCKNIPVLFQHGRASNTALSLYWYSKEDYWKELYKR